MCIRDSADYALYLPKIYLKVTNIYSINQRNRFIVYQVRVVRHSVRQWPHTFKPVSYTHLDVYKRQCYAH